MLIQLYAYLHAEESKLFMSHYRLGYLDCLEGQPVANFFKEEGYKSGWNDAIEDIMSNQSFE